MKWPVALGILLIVIFSGCVTQTQPQLTRIALGNATLLVEIADSPEEQAKGLMYRTSLPEDRGMLFVFTPEKEVSFWMKNTLIPLDMVFINSSGHITKILENVPPCEADPCPTYPSGGPIKYVVEANAGWAGRNGISKDEFIGFKI